MYSKLRQLRTRNRRTQDPVPESPPVYVVVCIHANALHAVESSIVGIFTSLTDANRHALEVLRYRTGVLQVAEIEIKDAKEGRYGHVESGDRLLRARRDDGCARYTHCN